MFDKSIIETDRFLNISLTAKALYFLLGMEADDEGFVSPKRVLRIYGGEAGDLKNLIDTGLVIPFQSGVVVITDWNKNNWLDTRRIKPTEYQDEKKLLAVNNDKYTLLSGCLAIAQPEEKRGVEKRGVEKAIDFEEFWKEYPNKVGKGAARKSWLKISPTPELKAKIIASIELHKKSRQWISDNGKFVPHPATFLNQERWEDEVKEIKKIESITI